MKAVAREVQLSVVPPPGMPEVASSQVLGAPRAPATAAAAPKSPASAALVRLQSAPVQLLPHVQYQLTRLGVAGQTGLAALAAAAVIVVSALLPAKQAEQRLAAELARAPLAAESASPGQKAPKLLTSLPARTEISAVIAQVYAEAKGANVSLDTGHYVYTPAKGGAVSRYELEFPVKASYPDIRTFIDHTLAALPAAALGKLRFERKAVGDAVVAADIVFVVFVRSGELP
jgi:hypothetical protein